MSALKAPRPVTIVIIVGVFLSICAVIGARLGTMDTINRIPTLRVSSEFSSVKAPPYLAQDLDGNQISNPPITLKVAADGHISIRFDVTMKNRPVTVITTRATLDGQRSTESRVLPASHEAMHMVEVKTESGFAIHVAVTGLTSIRTSETDEKPLPAEWSIEPFVQLDDAALDDAALTASR